MTNAFLRAALLSAAVAVVPSGGQAQSPAPEGCSAFAWPLDAVRTALIGNVAKIATSAQAPNDFELALAPIDGVKFPTPPARKPKHDGTFGGFVTIMPAAGKLLQVSASEEAWIDAVQDGRMLKTAAFSGKQGCPGLRKSLRFEGASTSPITLQVSGSDAPTIRIDVRGVE